MTKRKDGICAGQSPRATCVCLYGLLSTQSAILEGGATTSGARTTDAAIPRCELAQVYSTLLGVRRYFYTSRSSNQAEPRNEVTLCRAAKIGVRRSAGAKSLFSATHTTRGGCGSELQKQYGENRDRLPAQSSCSAFGRFRLL